MLKTLIIVAGAVLSIGFAAEQVSEEPELREVDLEETVQILSIETSADEVVVDIAVPAAIGRLAPVDDNFGVTDGGQLVGVRVNPIDTSPETVLLIDTSGSMRGSALAAAKAAASTFVEELPTGSAVGLISFGDVVEVHQTPTLDRADLLAAIDRLEATGTETILWDALSTAAELTAASPDGRSAIVVLSDGDDTASESGLSDVAEQFLSGSNLLYAVAIESPEADMVALAALTEEVGGQFQATADVAQLDPLYADIAGRLSNLYQLRFTPVRSGERTMVVSVATESSVATARALIQTPPQLPAPNTEQSAGAGNSIGTSNEDVQATAPAQALGPWASPAMLWVGLGSMFAAFTMAIILIGRPTAQVRLDAATSADRLGGIGTRLGRAADRVISNHDGGRRIDSRLEAADVNLRPGEFALGWLVGSFVLVVGSWAVVGLGFAIMMVPVAATMALVFLSIRAERRRSAFADQLTETLGILASSLRAGQSLPAAIELVAAEAPSPTASQFHRISFEIRVGRDLTESVRDAAERMRSPDLKWLSQAIDINRELGGDLTEVLDNVAATIRERRSLARQVNALSAEGRMSGWVLLGLPVVLFVFSWWRTPDSIEAMMTAPLGRLLLGAAVTGMIVGHLWIRQLVKVRL